MDDQPDCSARRQIGLLALKILDFDAVDAYTSGEMTRERKLRLGSRLMFGVALAETVLVVPLVWIDPAANRGPACIAFLVNALMNALAGAGLRTPIVRRGGGWGKALLWAVAVVLALLGLALLDAFFAFATHENQVAPAVLLVCIAAEMAAAGLSAAATHVAVPA